MITKNMNEKQSDFYIPQPNLFIGSYHCMSEYILKNNNDTISGIILYSPPV